MAGRFAHALRTGQRGTSPRRARNIALIAAVIFCIALASVSTRARFPSARVGAHFLEPATVSRSTASHEKAHAEKQPDLTAKIVTCPACRLNALPRVKEFVYKHAKTFEPALKVNFVLGEDPRLHLYSGGREVENIDLAAFDTPGIMKKLYSFGIRPTTVTPEVAKALGPNPLLQTGAGKAA